MANDLDRTPRHEEEPSDFYIPATRNLHDGRIRTLKSGDGFALLDRNGDALAVPDGVLGFYWRDTRHLSRLDLREAIRGAVADTVSLRMAKRQTCTVEESAESLDIVADHVRVRQILFNLLSNASKFTPESGTIILSAVRAPVPLPVPGERAGETPRLVPRDSVWVSVRDSGIGI